MDRRRGLFPERAAFSLAVANDTETSITGEAILRTRVIDFSTGHILETHCPVENLARLSLRSFAGVADAGAISPPERPATMRGKAPRPIAFWRDEVGARIFRFRRPQKLDNFVGHFVGLLIGMLTLPSSAHLV